MVENKSYRIHTHEGEEYVDIKLNVNQDIDMFEMLSLKINSENFYRLHTSNYGCVAGRVLANDAIGVPNVKLSIFIAADEETKADSVLSYLYPFSSPLDKNEDNVRYNLLSEEEISACHQAVGTFPSKRLVLDDNNVFEIYDKYYKFTTTTNNAGDYMIFGVPLGTQRLHIDVDLSDIGDLLSQSPRDFIYKGYDLNEFESPTKFKKGTDIERLPQILMQDESVFVHPFWGDPSEMGETDSTGVRITRKDINLSYKFEPTCVFIGSLITDEKSNGITKHCVPTERMGKMDRLTTGEGTIEMIRKTPDGSVESFNVRGAHLIDGNGVWCYQIPMNLDFVRTDEEGNIVPTDNPNKGLPTRTTVRFRISLNDMISDYENNHLTKMLVPNNPKTTTDLSNCYRFGTMTSDKDFRNLLWNKVYTIKSYIPRLQKSNSNRERRFTGIKAVNVNVGNNPIPYNNLRIDITFMFVMQCAIMHALIWFAGVYNYLMYKLAEGIGRDCNYVDWNNVSCITVGDGMCPDLDGWYFAPRCEHVIHYHGDERAYEVTNFINNTIERIKEKEFGDNAGAIGNINDDKSLEYQNRNMYESICITNKIDYFMQCIELALAQEYEVIQFDFYNDWLNGVVYIPRWFANIKKKRSYLLGLIRVPERVQACLEGNVNNQRRYVQQCALDYDVYFNNGVLSRVEVTTQDGCAKNILQCHKSPGRRFQNLQNVGFIHPEQTIRNEKVYYFRPCNFINGRRVNYFLTDIVLLGSLSENDIDGVPQAFRELVSSSYKMPTNIAATNIDHLGRMYGNGDGFMCGGTSNTLKPSPKDSESGVTVTTDYNTWISQDTDASGGQDSSEPILTEMSGIDWGYEGKDIEDLKSKVGTAAPKLFKPGGHFLGISCLNSETNIVSCVNLSRICEIGVEPSQSHKPQMREDGVYYSPAYIMPTGLISRDEISDGSFRNIFATLNINGLSGSINTQTGRFEYKFTPMYLNNFDGALKNRVTSSYYSHTGKTATSGDLAVLTSYGAAHTYENLSPDYYYFRFSADTKNTIKMKYLGVKDDTQTDVLKSCSLPMYENSFYFYFGLHDGQTALDKFYENFYAECFTTPRAIMYLDVDKKDISACEAEDAKGSAVIKIMNYAYNGENIKYVLDESDDGVNYIPIRTGTVGQNSFELRDLDSKYYKITVEVEVEGKGELISYFDIIKYTDLMEENNIVLIDIAYPDGYISLRATDNRNISESVDYVFVSFTSDVGGHYSKYYRNNDLQLSELVIADEAYEGQDVRGDYDIDIVFKCGTTTKTVHKYINL